MKLLKWLKMQKKHKRTHAILRYGLTLVPIMFFIGCGKLVIDQAVAPFSMNYANADIKACNKHQYGTLGCVLKPKTPYSSINLKVRSYEVAEVILRGCDQEKRFIVKGNRFHKVNLEGDFNTSCQLNIIVSHTIKGNSESTFAKVLMVDSSFWRVSSLKIREDSDYRFTIDTNNHLKKDFYFTGCGNDFESESESRYIRLSTSDLIKVKKDCVLIGSFIDKDQIRDIAIYVNVYKSGYLKLSSPSIVPNKNKFNILGDPNTAYTIINYKKKNKGNSFSVKKKRVSLGYTVEFVTTKGRVKKLVFTELGWREYE